MSEAHTAEWGWRMRAVEYAKLLHPDLYVRLKSLRSSLRPRDLRH